jgi:hypothetical protein
MLTFSFFADWVSFQEHSVVVRALQPGFGHAAALFGQHVRMECVSSVLI